MKKKNKIIIVITIGILVAFVGLYLIVYKGVFKFGDNNEEGDTYDANIRILTESYPTDIYVLGDEVGFRSKLKYIAISNISDEIFDDNKEQNSILVINDLNGSVKLSDEELSLIKKIISNDKFDFYYLGRDKLNVFKEKGIYTEERPSDELCLALVTYVNQPFEFNGLLTSFDLDQIKNSPEGLGFILVNQFIRVIKSNN